MLWVGTSWKMNGTIAFAREYAATLRVADAAGWDGVQPFVIPPATCLHAFAEALAGVPDVLVGAQNAHWEDAGAWTGEVSVPQVIDAGADLVEVGHSERRAHFGDTDAVVHAKVAAILEHGLRPVLCVGEPEDVFRAGRSADFIVGEAESALAGLDAGPVILAYEPIWAIGAGGREPRREDLASAFDALADRFADRVTAIIYGGSVNPGNAAAVLAVPGVQGLFVGRSAWRAEGYLEILKIAGEAARSPLRSRR